MSTLTKETRTTIGVVLTAVVLAVGGALGFADIGQRLDRIEQQDRDRWSRTDMKLWVLQTMNANPTLKLPKPEDKHD